MLKSISETVRIILKSYNATFDPMTQEFCIVLEDTVFSLHDIAVIMNDIETKLRAYCNEDIKSPLDYFIPQKNRFKLSTDTVEAIERKCFSVTTAKDVP